MRKYMVLLATALALTSMLAGARSEIPAPGASAPITISPEELQRQVDGRSLPLTFIEEPY
jgi:hypothetical protein